MNANLITPAEFWKTHAFLHDATLIDVSDSVDFSHIHVEGSVHLPPQDVVKVVSQAKVCDKRLYLISRHGKFAAALGGELERRGYDNVTAIAGGTEAWAASGLPVSCERTLAEDLLIAIAVFIVVGSIIGSIIIADLLMLPVLAMAVFIAVALVRCADTLANRRTNQRA
jgi:rhodanese-related sulfurtransferase